MYPSERFPVKGLMTIRLIATWGRFFWRLGVSSYHFQAFPSWNGCRLHMEMVCMGNFSKKHLWFFEKRLVFGEKLPRLLHMYLLWIVPMTLMIPNGCWRPQTAQTSQTSHSFHVNRIDTTNIFLNIQYVLSSQNLKQIVNYRVIFPKNPGLNPPRPVFFGFFPTESISSLAIESFGWLLHEATGTAGTLLGHHGGSWGSRREGVSRGGNPTTLDVIQTHFPNASSKGNEMSDFFSDWWFDVMFFLSKNYDFWNWCFVFFPWERWRWFWGWNCWWEFQMIF